MERKSRARVKFLSIIVSGCLIESANREIGVFGPPDRRDDNMMNDEIFDFENESEVDVRKRPPAGTVAHVQIRPDRDGNLGDFKRGSHEEFGPWMSIPFEVTEGEYKGEWASMMLNLKTTDVRFRRTFEITTGVDVSQGAQVSFNDFTDKLVSGIFEAEIGPEKRRGEETGYTQCYKLLRRVGERDGQVSASDGDVPAIGASDDEDVPF